MTARSQGTVAEVLGRIERRHGPEAVRDLLTAVGGDRVWLPTWRHYRAQGVRAAIRRELQRRPGAYAEVAAEYGVSPSTARRAEKQDGSEICNFVPSLTRGRGR